MDGTLRNDVRVRPDPGLIVLVIQNEVVFNGPTDHIELRIERITIVDPIDVIGFFKPRRGRNLTAAHKKRPV
jgi:hypothetical protein